MAFVQILWTQNETRLHAQSADGRSPTGTGGGAVARGKLLFTNEVAQGGAGCASCHHNGNTRSNGVVDDTFQDFNIHEPGVVAETTVDNEGPFTRLVNDYFFKEFDPPQDLGGRQNISSRNTKHLRSFWDSVPRWLHHGAAHTIREILLDARLAAAAPGERGFNFRTVRTDHSRVVAFDFLGGPRSPPADRSADHVRRQPRRWQLHEAGGRRQGSALRQPRPPGPEGGQQPGLRQARVSRGPAGARPARARATSRRWSSAAAINPALAARGIRVITDTHGETSHLSAAGRRGAVDVPECRCRSRPVGAAVR